MKGSIRRYGYMKVFLHTEEITRMQYVVNKDVLEVCVCVCV